MTYTLHYAPDNASLIIRQALEEIGAEYNTVLVNRSSSEQRSEQFQKLNPNGFIPVCIIDGEPIFETAAILMILCERHKTLSPLPNSKAHMHFLKWMVCLSNGLHTDLRQLFYQKDYIGKDSGLQNSHRDITRQRLNKRFAMFDTAIAKSSGSYMFGDKPSAVDIYLATCLRWAQLYPLSNPDNSDIRNFSTLGNMVKTLETRPAIIRACKAEGISMPAFSSPTLAQPPEGSAV